MNAVPTHILIDILRAFDLVKILKKKFILIYFSIELKSVFSDK